MISCEPRVLVRGDEMPGDHRGDFQTCPHCDHRLPFLGWDKLSHTLSLRPRVYRKGSVAISAECPNCFESSWVHVEFDSLRHRQFPEGWRERADKESAAQKLRALREWGRSLCWQCAKLQSGTICHGTWRECSIGMGPAETTCDAFRAARRRSAKR